MTLNVVQLTQDLVALNSESQTSNASVANFLEPLLGEWGFMVERLEYSDNEGVRKVNLVAKKGDGTGGLGFFSHSDTVPGNSDGWDPFSPTVEQGRLIGRGSCDMKGPLAATLVASATVDAARLKAPLFVVIAADEEVGYKGALNVVAESKILKQGGWPDYGVVTEPTNLVPVYAHKGRTRIQVTAHGRAAHTSTNQGVSANFLIAPFLAEMATLAQVFQTDNRFMNPEFDPPTNSFNMVINDGNCATNVTAAKTVCTLDLRVMPDDHHETAAAIITATAEKYHLHHDSHTFDPFYIAPTAEIIQAALQAASQTEPQTVPYGTEAVIYKDYCQPVILGPGDIAQAHTVGEWIAVEALSKAVEVYGSLIEEICLN